MLSATDAATFHPGFTAALANELGVNLADHDRGCANGLTLIAVRVVLSEVAVLRDAVARNAQDRSARGINRRRVQQGGIVDRENQVRQLVADMNNNVCNCNG
ncbi:MAG TPA: hypothetical protein VK453_25765 [Micromonosporaceae bacterium]|nr:hypothetical protein [Micromonosporaceae bacterium]